MLNLIIMIIIIIIVIQKNRPTQSMWVGLGWILMIDWVVLNIFLTYYNGLV